MTIDNTEFIARHHKAVQRSSAAPYRRGGYEGLLAIFSLLLFAGVLFFILTVSDMGETTRLISGGAFLLSVLGGLVAYRSYRVQTDREKSLALFRSVLEGGRAARVITGGNNETVYYNQEFEQLCRGVGPSAYETFLRLFQDDGESLPHLNVLADKAYRGIIDTIEVFSKYEDRERWLVVTAYPVAGYDRHIHWRIEDVTEKYIVEQAVREEREKLIDFTDNAPVGFFSVDEAGRFVFANATFARWLGEDLEQLLDCGFLHTYLVSPPEKAAPYDLVENAGPRQVVELQMKGVGGTPFLASINQTVVKDHDGNVTTRAVVHDLTTEREMRTALRESEARFQKFFEEAPLGIVLVDEAGNVTDCNGPFAKMLGKSPADVEGKPFKSFVSNDASSVMKHIEQVDKAETPLEIVLKGKNGTIDTQMHARRFKEGRNTVLHFIDVTDRKELEAQFVQSQKMQAIGQLAGGVAHDFNNLLTAIIGFCDLLLLRHKPGDPSFADIMQIKQNSNRAANLVRQLLAFSRQQTLRPRVQDITDILTELSHLMRRLIGAGITLDLVHGQDLGLVKVDEGQMEQVLINLAVNARDAMDGGGALSVETENFTNRKPLELVSEVLPPGHWIQIKVRDTGCGIPKNNLSRIFEPFFTTKDVGHGTGLGLATVYGIIKQTDGFLDVHSKEGQGTTFVIYLPRSDEIEEEERQEAPDFEDEAVKDLTGMERILLVEDEDAVRTFSQRALANKGYEVLAADSGESALTLFEGQEDPLDLLITDVVMPNMDGPTLAQRIRQNNKDLKIIFISGYTEDKLKDYMGPNTYFLPKPFTLKQLAEKVKSVLDD